MAKSRRDVKFQHRGSASRPRRPSSISDVGEAAEHLAHSQHEDKPDASTPPLSESQKKWQNFVTRFIWSIIMMGSFIGAILAGHVYLIFIITAIQIISFREVIGIIDVPSRARSLRFTKSLNWYFLGISMYFLYGESIIYYFKHIVMVDRILVPFATHHRFICFMLYIFGFVFFVTSLQKGHYRFQFTQFAWTHIALYLIVVQAHFVMNNIFEGMIWFLLPVLLVITNDIMAYACGMLFGRTQLIKLSPKKTVEGFIGAWVFTILFGYFFSWALMGYKYFICPVNDLGANFFSGLECEPNPVFRKQTYLVPFHPPEWTHIPQTFTLEPMQFHTLMFATFASLIAPFGGFFASGIKRTFKIKDFGDSIPGHGGITDRMDCQFIMGTLAYMYYQGFISMHRASVGGVIETAITGLVLEDQMEVALGLVKNLVNQGWLENDVLEYLTGVRDKRR